MPRPSAPRSPADGADHEGRHRRGRAVGGDVWQEWDDLLADGGEDDVPDREQRHEPQAPSGHDGRQEPVDDGWRQAPERDEQQKTVDDGEDVSIFTVPASLRSVDVRVGGRAVRGMLLVAAVVLVVLGGRWWWVAQGADAEPVEPLPAVTAAGEPGVPVTGQQEGSEGAGGAGEEGEDGEGEEIDIPGGGEGADPGDVTAGALTVVVHVVGEVRTPGVVELPAGSRVADAVAAAGGLTDAADQTSLNLARALVDGEQVWVGAPGEEPPPSAAQAATGGPGTGGGSGAGGSSAGSGAPPPLDLNRATQAELEELPGVGPVTAGRILAWREEHGRFSVVEELMEVSGIGERTFAQLQPLVTTGG